MIQTSNFHSLKSGFLWYFLLLFEVCLLFFNFHKEFAYTDDFQFLLDGSKSDFVNRFYLNGRVLTGLLNSILYEHITTVSELPYIRGLAIVGTLLFILFLFNVLKVFYSPAISFLTVSFFLFMPTIAIINLWACTFQVSWGLLLALMSGHLALKFVLSRRKYQAVLASIYGLISLALYQPSFTFFIIPGFIHLIKTSELKNYLSVLIFHFAIYMIYYVFYRSGLSIMELAYGQDRSGILIDPLNQLKWFLKPLKTASQLNFILGASGWIDLVRSLSAVALAINSIRILQKIPLKRGISILSLIGISLLLAYLPNLLSVDEYVSFRTLGTLNFLFIFFIADSIQSIKIQKIKNSVFALLFLFLASNAFYNINSGFIDIHVKEYQSVKSFLESRLKDSELKTIVIKPARLDFLKVTGKFKRIGSDEFGRLSTPSTWVPVPFIRLILKDIGLDPSDFKIVVNGTNHQNSLLIDVEQIFLESR